MQQLAGAGMGGIHTQVRISGKNAPFEGHISLIHQPAASLMLHAAADTPNLIHHDAAWGLRAAHRHSPAYAWEACPTVRGGTCWWSGCHCSAASRKARIVPQHIPLPSLLPCITMVHMTSQPRETAATPGLHWRKRVSIWIT